tara:strand:- start:1710 stop:1871 length:162 start_codon:yes stop_codon:yes gene_type:complete
MKIGDLVRPKSFQFREQIGVVIAVGFMGSIGVRLMCGRIATYNRGSLEILNEG